MKTELDKFSASGLARVSRDRSKIAELYAPDWKACLAGTVTRGTAPPTILGSS